MANPKLTDAIIDAAILGFEEQKRKLNEQIAELRAMRGGTTPATETPMLKPRREMSAAGRKAIARTQRKRWAEMKTGPTASPVKAAKPVKKKRVLSAAGKTAIVAALKKRWAAKKAAAKSAK
jgi:hypothetical protein